MGGRHSCISCGFVTVHMNSEVKGQCSATVGVREIQRRREAYGAETDPQGNPAILVLFSTVFDCEGTFTSYWAAAAASVCKTHRTQERHRSKIIDEFVHFLCKKMHTI